MRGGGCGGKDENYVGRPEPINQRCGAGEGEAIEHDLEEDLKVFLFKSAGSCLFVQLNCLS